MIAVLIHILEVLFVIGISGSALVVVWVAVEDIISIREKQGDQNKNR